MNSEAHPTPIEQTGVLPVPDIDQLAAKAAGVRLGTDAIGRPYAVSLENGRRLPVSEAESLARQERISQGVISLGTLSIEQANADVDHDQHVTFNPEDHKKASYLDRRNHTDEDRLQPALDLGKRLTKVQDAAAAKEEFAKDDNSWMQRMSETAAKRTDKADYRRRQAESLKVLAERKATRKGEETEFNKLKWQLGEGVVNLDPKKYRAIAAENYAARRQAATEATEQKEQDRRAHLLSLAQEQHSQSQIAKPDANTMLNVVHNNPNFKQARKDERVKLEVIQTALQEFADKARVDGQELTDDDKLTIRTLMREGQVSAELSSHYRNASKKPAERTAANKAASEQYEAWSADLFNGVDLRTNEEQVVDTHNELRDLAQKYADVDTDELDDAEVAEIKNALTGYTILRDANPGVENPALTEGADDILSLTAKYDRAKARTAIPIGTDDIPRRQQGNAVNGNQVGNSGRTRRFGRPGRRSGAHQGAQTPAGAAALVDDVEGANRRPTMRERMRGHGRSALAATAALLATAGLAYTGLSRSDYDPATLANARASAGGIGSESGEQTTGGSTTRPASAENESPTSGTISAQEQSFRAENRYPWNRVDTLIKEMGVENLSAMNLMESRMPAAKEKGFDFLKVDQPGHGTGDKSTNTIYFLVRPDGSITDNVNELMGALNLSTELQIRNAINNAK